MGPLESNRIRGFWLTMLCSSARSREAGSYIRKECCSPPCLGTIGLTSTYFDVYKEAWEGVRQFLTISCGGCWGVGGFLVLCTTHGIPTVLGIVAGLRKSRSTWWSLLQPPSNACMSIDIIEKYLVLGYASRMGWSIHSWNPDDENGWFSLRSKSGHVGTGIELTCPG